MLPEWNVNIAPRLQAGETVLITAHGNSLRALVKHLDGISEEDILGINIPTGVPLVYKLDANNGLAPIRMPNAEGLLNGEYLGDQQAIKAAAAAVAAQAKGN